MLGNTVHDCNTETVSVVLCTYNGAAFLREQLDSVIAQTYPLHEIIIQDDNSTDGTIEIAREYAARYGNISVYKNEDEHSVNGNFFSAMRKATGKYIAVCDQDDIWEKDKVEKQVRAIGDKLLCSGHSKPFSEDGSGVFYDPRRPNVNLLRLINSSEIPGHTILMRREVLDMLPYNEYGCYDIRLSTFAAVHDSIVYLDDILVHQRRYATAATYTTVKYSTPSVSNGWRMLWYCIKNYHKIKEKAVCQYVAWEKFLANAGADTYLCREGIRMLQLQQSFKVVDFFRLQLFCLRHRKEICHTPGKFPVDIIRALLFPVTFVYYRRYLLD